MASITIRNLDPAIKDALRRRAAANGRSMEEEARHFLAELAVAANAPRSSGLAATPAGLALPIAGATPSGSPLDGKAILLVIGGGIAAYKSLDLIRRLRERGAMVRVVMTAAAQEFVTDLAAGALSGGKVYCDLFSRDDEHDVGHIRLAREAALILVAPATADLMAKMAHGLANDLASAVILAANSPVLIAPAMNPSMWTAKATQRNAGQLAADGVHVIGPNSGEMAESGEAGRGRMAEPLEIVAAAEKLLDRRPKPLSGRRIIVTSGPTQEPIDPVRYISNRSSGKQGHAIAAALAALGADVQLVSGPVTLPDPPGVKVTRVLTARQMQAQTEALLPADAAVCVAAVADWRVESEAGEKIKKKPGEGPPVLRMTENPDILAGIGHHRNRPFLVIGFAAETQSLTENAEAKLKKKGADIIVANDVSADSGVGGAGGVFGGDKNRVRIVSRSGIEDWPEMDKEAVAKRLAALIAEKLQSTTV